MKKKILTALWMFTKIDLLCYVIYFPATILLALIFYEDVAPGHRDFTPVFWSMHIIFFIAYHLIYTKQIDDKRIVLSNNEFSIKETVLNFFKTEHLQIILMSVISVVYEATMLTNPKPTNLIIEALFMFIPSAAAITIPIIRTLVGFTISMLSMLISYVIISYKKHQYWNTKRK
jgi:hypothetical protein